MRSWRRERGALVRELRVPRPRRARVCADDLAERVDDYHPRHPDLEGADPQPPVSVHAYQHVLGGRGQERRLQVAHAIGPDQHALGRRGYARAVDHRADRVRVASERAPHGERDVSLRTRYVPSNELKWQRTVAVIMRLTSKATLECAGSAFQVALRHLHKALLGAEPGRGIANPAVAAAVESPL